MKKIAMEIVNTQSAGIDVGSRFHMVAIDQNPENVRKFGIYTSDHFKLIQWLRDNEIRSIAMESTGSYWQTLFDALQNAGFEVVLANGNQTKNVKGKKSDMLDCLWIQKLHSLGLLSGSFLPAFEIQNLRTYYSHRQYLINQLTRYINKMQKALRLMNVRLDIAINDIMGMSGRAIIEAILAGERNPAILAELANYRIKKSKEEIAKSLEGNWREDLLFELRSCLSLHDTYKERLLVTDQELEIKIASLQKSNEKPAPEINSKNKSKKKNKNTVQFDIGSLAKEYFGVDLMQIPGVSYNTVLCLLTQVGNDIYKFPTAKHFCSWLRVAPDNKITGGKVISSRTPKGKNRLALALRQAANSIGNQKEGELNSFFKRIAFRKDRSSAVTATARKLATIIFNMITKKQNYVPAEQRALSDKVKNTMIKNIKKKIANLQLTENQITFLFSDDGFKLT